MTGSNPNYFLYLKNQKFEIPKIQETIISVSKKIADELLQKNKYFVNSDVSYEIFNNFVKYWQDHEKVPQIDSTNFDEYQQLSQEFGMMSDVILSKKNNQLINISFLLNNSNCDKSEIESRISKNLDQYLDERYADQMYKIPIQSLYNIFYNKERILNNYTNAYRFITNSLNFNYSNNNDNQKSELLILAHSLDGNKLMDESPELLEDLIQKTNDFGFKSPKFSLTSLIKSTNPVLQQEIKELILLNNYYELKNKINQEQITFLQFPDDNLAKIPDLALFNCTSLKKLIAPMNLNLIGKYAFFNCSCLKEVFIPESTTIIDNGAFCGCSKLEKIKFPKNLKQIETLAFYSCSSINEVNLPSGLEKIGGSAFSHCHKLEKLIIPEKTKIVGGYVFCDCTSLKYVKLPENDCILGGMFQGCIELDNIEIPSSVKEIHGNVFSGCKSLKTISFLSSVNKIHESAFSGCISLKTISFLSSVNEIHESAFSGCISLKTISIPSDIKIIHKSTFENCTSLTDVSLQENLVSIENFAFSGCSKLSKINIPTTVTSIGSCAFKSCTSLVNVVLPPNLTYIHWGTFWDCSSLEHVVFPNSEIGINEYAFVGCQKLKEVEFSLSLSNGSNCLLCSNSFDSHTKIKIK